MPLPNNIPISPFSSTLSKLLLVVRFSRSFLLENTKFIFTNEPSSRTISNALFPRYRRPTTSRNATEREDEDEDVVDAFNFTLPDRSNTHRALVVVAVFRSKSFPSSVSSSFCRRVRMEISSALVGADVDPRRTSAKTTHATTKKKRRRDDETPFPRDLTIVSSSPKVSVSSSSFFSHVPRQESLRHTTYVSSGKYGLLLT